MDQTLHKLLEQIQRQYHAWRGPSANDRGDQFDSHLATLHDVIDWTAHTKTCEEG